ncbi:MULTISPECIES: MarR family winged helix-turn-helix transcriptional regulator [unclassified Streptomyces]|uniref:MarR family transcriptional regulator n=1 Tax=Streptomyces evansiae TaxID=3075535 RepID=A0ABD5E0E5_9ACTN|nr:MULTISPECIES: MarR family transcriptional regulator [unclassified Streptomyces]EGJ78928.1 putative MarR family transcriptional regulator [Streptomyces sp. Tu6071]MDT0408602.1 MarR family transcriptional regulator [Streptomyces sp. DSM 41979]MDT0414934.1 MarR family transcriptional regulator [Streptomyces sp. DSM 41982]
MDEIPLGQDDVTALLEGLTALSVRHLTVHDISFTAAMTLGRLSRTGPTRLTVLASDGGVSQPSMTQLVQRLEKQGLVRRVRCPDDGRAVLVSVTDAGRDVVRERREARAERLHQLLDTLSAEERLTLLRAARDARPALETLLDTAVRTQWPTPPGRGGARPAPRTD